MMSDYLTAREVIDRLPISRATFYRHVRNDPTFPKPRVIGKRSFWSEADVSEWAAPKTIQTRLLHDHIEVGEALENGVLIDYFLVPTTELTRWLASKGFKGRLDIDATDNVIEYARGTGDPIVELPEEISMLYTLTFAPG